MSKRTQHDFKGLQDWVPIFKAGPQKDSLGREKVWTHDELDQVVANHSADHPAPHVITHKELYSPFAYGQSAEVKREGDVLYVKSKNVEPQFEKLIKDGRLFERSVRLVPSPKGWKLGHIAWLGAEPPAVDGLAPVQFSAETEAHDYSVDWRATSTLARMMRRLREFLIAKFGAEEADRVMPEWDVDDLVTAAAEQRAEDVPASPSFSAPTQQGDVSMLTEEDLKRAREEARAEAKAEFAAEQTTLQQQLQTERESRLRAEFSANITEAIDAGRLTPAQAEGAVDFMLQLSREPMEFVDNNLPEEDRVVIPAVFLELQHLVVNGAGLVEEWVVGWTDVNGVEAFHKADKWRAMTEQDLLGTNYGMNRVVPFMRLQ
jgi:hypothetical protein